ncbi:MAG: ATP phosphoribosyltransferase regulatory subunit [Gammaproteobacteria bacterium]
MQRENWLLPEGIDEVLPPQAAVVEQLRRNLLDLYARWGYELVFPPFVEYLESLLINTGGDLDLKTFKVTDQLSGRTLGMRADITTQAARIDAHQLRRNGVTRLCYAGTVLHTRGDGFAGSRAPLQVGAELYGHSGVESDLEIICLMMESLQLSGLTDIHIDLGHVGIFRGLVRQSQLGEHSEMKLFNAIQRKAISEIEDLVASLNIGEAETRMFIALPELCGDDALDRAKELFVDANAEVKSALTDLMRLADLVRQRMPELPLHFDLAELRGYHYHTGVVFAAFVPGLGQEIARGGRYDDIGEAFGRARPACGFSSDLKLLMRLGQDGVDLAKDGIFAPWSDDPEQHQAIERLRSEGATVIMGLPGQDESASEMGCDSVFVRQDGKWLVTSA